MKARRKDLVYFDYAASTPVDTSVITVMEKCLREYFANPSSVHISGQQANYIVDQSRRTIASFLNCKAENIIFTSGATESNNIAIQGSVEPGQHIITTQIEHPAVLEVCKYLENHGVEVTYLPVDKNGVISVVDLRKAVQVNTALVSIMYVNNEIGSIQPIEGVSRALEEINQTRSLKIKFHVDAVQAVNYHTCDIAVLGVDMMSISAHKIYGPKGIGILYSKDSLAISPLFFGGAQQKAVRPGTLPTHQIAGLATAVQLLGDTQELSRIQSLKQMLVDGISTINNSSCTIKPEFQTPGICHILIQGIAAQTAMIKLDQLGVVVSAGAACAAGSPRPSYVLKSINKQLPDTAALRISLGRQTSSHDIVKLIEALREL